LLGGGEDRWDAETEVLLFSAARRDLVRRVILPALEDGSWVVCDRFIDSMRAYQGAGRGVSNMVLAAAQSIAIGDLKPNLTLILDVSQYAVARIRRRGPADRFERLGRDFHDRVRAAYRAIADMEPERCVLIDADAPRWKVHLDILNTVHQRFQVALKPVLYDDLTETNW
jgi:dTMP kinase